MAFSPGMVWQVQSGGSDTLNGGGFRGGAVIAAPSSAPTLTGAGTGGTIPAGTYYVVITYQDPQGETQKSPQSSVTLTGTTSKITVTSPTRPTDGVTWNVYVGTTSGGPYFSQGTGLAYGTDRVITSTPPTTGLGPPGVDYSQQDSAQISYTDLAIDATTNTLLTSAANPFGQSHIGNVIPVSSGTGFTVQRLEIQNVSAAGVATVDKSAGTLGSTGGNGRLGGAFASPGQAGAVKIASNIVFLKNVGGATPTTYLLSSSSNVSGGRIVDNSSGTSSAPNYWVGYETTRTVNNTDPNRPRMYANAASVSCFSAAGAGTIFRNIDVGQTGVLSTVTGVNLTAITSRCERVVATGCTSSGFVGSSATTRFTDVAAINCSSGFPVSSSFLARFIASGCGTSVTLGTSAVCEDGIIANSTVVGASVGGNGATMRRVSFSGNLAGITLSGGFSNNLYENIVIWGSTNTNYNDTSGSMSQRFLECASGGGGLPDSLMAGSSVGAITLTSDPFVNAAGGNYQLNDASGGGALLKSISSSWFGFSTTTTYRTIGGVGPAPPSSTPASYRRRMRTTGV